MVSKKKSVKDNFHANTALILSLGFWIPIFNIGLAFVSIIMALRALKLISAEPKRYGGFKKALFSLGLSILIFITSIIFVSVYLYRKITCDVICDII